MIQEIETKRRRWQVPIRWNVNATFVLPEDLTLAEAERLCGWLRAMGKPAQSELTFTAVQAP